MSVHFTVGLRAVNVGSTKELLKLALRGRPKLFHFVSSVSVFLGLAPGGTPEETAELDFTRCVCVYARACVHVCVCACTCACSCSFVL